MPEEILPSNNHLVFHASGTASGLRTALSLTTDPRLDILLHRAVLFKDLPEALPEVLG
jgi:hypothetical protein